MLKRLSYEPIRAIKYPFKILLLGVFVFLGLLFTNEAVLGSAIFYDDFEECPVGILNNNCGWISTGSTTQATTSEFYHSGKSVYIISENGDNSEKTGEELATGTFSFWFKMRGYTAGANGESVSIGINTSVDLRFKCKWGHCGSYGGAVDFYEFGIGNQDFGYFDLNTWYNIQVEWRATTTDDKVRYNFNEAGWTDWQNYAYDDFTDLDKISLDNTAQTGLIELYLDLFDEIPNPIFCEDYLTYLTCQNVGCCWYYSFWLYESFCVECPTGECESGPDDCQNCLTEENCEAQELCYWFEGLCKFGTGSCGEGLELQFCENQADCENAGGYWYDDFCWLSAKVDLTSWEDYYSEYGDYATPSDWISNMASTTSLFLGQMGGFLSVFEKNFDLMEAFEKGKNFGEVIPKARGYLAIFNNFLGGFPIGEFFVFLLIFMLAVGVFRIMRNLFQLIKFW